MPPVVADDGDIGALHLPPLSGTVTAKGVLPCPPGLQIFNVNYALARKLFKPIIVCDISPNIAVQVINVEGINEQELLGSMRALSAWECPTR